MATDETDETDEPKKVTINLQPTIEGYKKIRTRLQESADRNFADMQVVWGFMDKPVKKLEDFERNWRIIEEALMAWLGNKEADNAELVKTIDEIDEYLKYVENKEDDSGN